MTDNVNENMLTINNNTETPQTPLNEQQNENEPIPYEVLHNVTTNYEKKRIHSKNVHKIKKIYNKIWVIIFMLLINFYPLVMAIIEVIKRKINNMDFHLMPVFQIICYILLFISLMIVIFCRSSDGEEIKSALISFFCLIIVWLIEIISYFIDHDKKKAEELMQLFIKFKIYGCIIVFGIDIIFLIIIAIYLNKF